MMNPEGIAIASAVWAVLVTGLAVVDLIVLRRRLRQLERHLAQALGIIGERDDVIEDLEGAVGNLEDRNIRINHDLKAIRDRFPRLWTCPVEGHTDVEWVGNTGYCIAPGCHESNAAPVVDEDVTRPYIPDYGVPTLNDPTVDPDDAWKGELR